MERDTAGANSQIKIGNYEGTLARTESSESGAPTAPIEIKIRELRGSTFLISADFGMNASALDDIYPGYSAGINLWHQKNLIDVTCYVKESFDPRTPSKPWIL